MDHGEKNLKQEYLAEESWQIQEHEKNCNTNYTLPDS